MTAYATIKGFEVMRMIRRRHCILIDPGSQAKCFWIDSGVSRHAGDEDRGEAEKRPAPGNVAVTPEGRV
ncbi:MAG: hypothetical protein ACXW36_09050, partial [Nitrospira sp.]